MIFKFGHLNNNSREFLYNNVFQREIYPNWSRVTVGPKDKHIRLILKILKSWNGPYGILYVLANPRLGHKPARYQSPGTYSYDEIELFSYTFQEYFEGDGRHHLWFIDVNTDKRIIYDNHNIIYIYGDDESVVDLLFKKGFSQASVHIPSPHEHRYNQEYDSFEDEIMEYFDWLEFPLQEEHDD